MSHLLTHMAAFSALPLLLLIPRAAPAQQVAAPAPETPGSSRGENVQTYNVVNSFESGVRLHSVSGDEGKYRSDVNYGNGLRLLASHLTVNSREGHGRLFDEIVLDTQGLGNDPYQFASLRVVKNKLYEYDLLWRLNNYYNPSLPISAGGHFENTQRRMQDHDLTLFPRGNARVFLGLSRNVLDGPALTTTQQFDDTGNEFPLFANVHQVFDEYRLGGQITVKGFRVDVMRVWENFREDTPNSLVAAGALGSTTLDRLVRAQPYHGNTPSWRLSLFRESGRHFTVNGRLTYSSGQRDFLMDELSAGVAGRFAQPIQRELLITGTGRRPMTAANLTLSFFPASKVTVTNHTAFDRIQMAGNSAFQQFDFGLPAAPAAYFDFLGVRAMTNATDLAYRPRQWLAVFGGYRYTSRRVTSVQQEVSAGTETRAPYSQESNLNAGAAGFRWMPLPPLTIQFDGEIGRAGRPFYTVSEKNYHALGGRVQYKRGSLLIAAQSRDYYNNNSVSVTFHTARSRTNSVDASWAPRSWLSFDAGYAKIHLDSISAISYYVNHTPVNDEASLYISNIHSGSAGIRLSVRRRAGLYFGYTQIRDVGDGRAFQLAANSRASNVPPFLAGVQVYPLSFSSPLVRLSVPIHPRLRWNAGYQRYAYGEALQPAQDYRANTAYTSLSWSF